MWVDGWMDGWKDGWEIERGRENIGERNTQIDGWVNV